VEATPLDMGLKRQALTKQVAGGTKLWLSSKEVSE
jgi:hypothetical protein